MHKYTIKHLTLLLCAIALTSCSFFDKDNTPEPKALVNFTPEVRPHVLWSTKAGSGVDDEYLKMGPAVGETAIYTASVNGAVTSINKMNGQQNWHINTRAPLTATPGIGDQIVVVASRRGDVIALSQVNGSQLWRTTVPGEVLASPAVGHQTVVVKTIDGTLRALSAKDGHELWNYQQTEPSLVLRGSSAPIIRDNSIFAGYANGNLVRLSLNNQLLWTQTIAIPEGAFAIQRMIDIDADPVVYGHHVYAATYQGKIASLDWETGQVLWSHDISSYTGMIANEKSVYISDAKSYVWSFDADSDAVNWRQTQLESRVVTGPAIMGPYVVVGDAQGYLHWLSREDGHFAGREKVGSPLYAAPIAQNNVLYALTSKGYLTAYTL